MKHKIYIKKMLTYCLIFIFFSLNFLFSNYITANELININAANQDELDTLPGIGPAKAQAIIDYRSENGDFSSIEDIINVSGIGDATYNNIKDLITTSPGQSEPEPGGAEEANQQTDAAASSSPSGENAGQGEEADDENADSQAEDKNAEPAGETAEGPASPSFNLGDIVINEFVSDPADNDTEWIELYCRLNHEVDLSGWIIEEGSGAKTKISQGKISQADNFFIIENPKGNLNNKGDVIFLRDNTGKLIDKIAYGDWDPGTPNANAPVAKDPDSTARKIDGFNTYNGLNDFTVTRTPTKGGANKISLEQEAEEAELSQAEMAEYDYSQDIIISEVFPNPAGSDKEDEFFELFNAGDAKVSLFGWRVGDESKKRFCFDADAYIKSGQYLAVYRPESKLAFNNSSDSVKLFQPLKDEPLHTVKYTKAIEGWSYARENLKIDKWAWTEIPTPGAANQIKNLNHAPQVDFYCPDEALAGKPILFDSSDTIDEDGDELSYAWDFGDGATNTLAMPEHTFFNPGTYNVRLTVRDFENESSKEKMIRIINSKDGAKTDTSLEAANGSVILNEILPDPEGSDAEEWIELYNNGESRVNLLNWRVDDIEGGSKPYTITDDFMLDAGKYYVLERAISRLALNNTDESVRLFNPDGKLVDQIHYEKAFTGEAYARGENNKWFWTTSLTPGKANIISVADSGSVALAGAPDASTVKIKEKSSEEIMETDLEKIKDLEIGDKIKVKGKVAVLPGILGSQYFYIVGSPGLQIYNYHKNFPALRIGDEVEVAGELSQSYGEWRLKTKTAEDIILINSGPEPEPENLSCEQITEDCTGKLVSVTGEVVEQTGSNVYLDDGTDEMRIYIKNTTGINAKNLKAGETVNLTGIVSRTKAGLRLMPRSSDDIIKKDPESKLEIGRVLGEVAVSDEWEIAKRNKKIELFKYLLIIAGTIIFVLSGLLLKLSRK